MLTFWCFLYNFYLIINVCFVGKIVVYSYVIRLFLFYFLFTYFKCILSLSLEF